jgi:hypothetical protein
MKDPAHNEQEALGAPEKKKSLAPADSLKYDKIREK